MLNTFILEVIVSVAPVVSFANESTGLEGGQQGHNFDVADTGNLRVVSNEERLLDDDDTLLEEVGVGGDSFFSANKHGECVFFV